MKRQVSYALWTNHEEAILRKVYPLSGTAGCLALLPRHTKVAVAKHAKALGLRRDFVNRIDARCNACQKVLPASMFYPRDVGLQQPCKACILMRRAARRLAAKTKESSCTA